MTITFSYNFQPTSLTSLDVRISQEDLKAALDPFLSVNTMLSVTS